MRKFQVLLRQPVDRRQALRAAGLLGAAAALPAWLTGCKTPGPSRLAADVALTPAEDWLRQVDPIQAAVIPASDFLGDQPQAGHRAVRDGTPGQLTGPATITTDVLIVGGGMAGLACAYQLRQRQPMVMEIAPNFGGNSRGESWDGVEYSIGAAYLVKPDDDDRLMTEYYKPLGLDKLWRHPEKDGDVVVGGKRVSGFWDGATVTDPAAKAQIKKLDEYFKSVLESSYPDIPPADGGELSAAIKALDQKTFLAALEQAAGGPLHHHVRALLEHYCWSSLGGAAGEISAAAGLNFYCGEFEGICALPGGNAQVARQLLKAIVASGVPTANLRVRTAVRKITLAGSVVNVQCQGPDGVEYLVAAKQVIVACPKFIAARIVDDMPAEQSEAIGNLGWRSYLVANVLLDQPLALDQYDLYLLGAEDETFADAQAAAQKQKTTDVILGHWAQGGHASKSVLTLYRGFPYDGARSKLVKPAAFNQYKAEFAAEVPAILQALGITAAVDPDRIRIARWGHPLVLASPGLLANGTAQKAAASIGGKIHFCNQDNWALPAMETCLTTALTTAAKVRTALG